MAKNLSRQKKLDTRIDFTPMVDMNMLLITFFMFCTTMLKPQTLQIALPFHDDKQQQDVENQDKVNQDNAITIIVNGEVSTDSHGVETSKGDGTVWYYTGFPYGSAEAEKIHDAAANNLQKLNLRPGKDDKVEVDPKNPLLKIFPNTTIQGLLENKNKALYAEYKELEKKWQEKGFSKASTEANDTLFQNAVKKLHESKDAKYESKPIVMIKPTGNANYADVVAVLDAMSIFQVSRFQIEHLNATDSIMLEQKGVKLEKPEAKPQANKE